MQSIVSTQSLKHVNVKSDGTTEMEMERQANSTLSHGGMSNGWLISHAWARHETKFLTPPFPSHFVSQFQLIKAPWEIHALYATAVSHTTRNPTVLSPSERLEASSLPRLSPKSPRARSALTASVPFKESST